MLQGFQDRARAFAGVGYPPFFRNRGEPFSLETEYDPLVEGYISAQELSALNAMKLDRMAKWLRASGLLPNLVSWCEFSTDYNTPDQSVISFPSIVGPNYASTNGGADPGVSYSSDGYSQGATNRNLVCNFTAIAQGTFIVKSDIAFSSNYELRYQLKRTDATNGLQFNTYNDSGSIYPIIDGLAYGSGRFPTTGFQNVFIHTSGRAGVIYEEPLVVVSNSHSYNRMTVGNAGADNTVQRRVLVFNKALNQTEREIVGALDTVANFPTWESFDPLVISYDAGLVSNGFSPTTATAKTWYQGLLDIMDAHSISRTGATAGMYLDGYTPGSGATAFSILGGNGTLLNGPTWVENGINIHGSGLEIRYNVGPVTGSGSVLVMRQNTNGVESPFDAYQFNNSLSLGGGFANPSSSSVVYCTQSGVEYYDGGATELSFPSASEITTLNIGIYGSTANNGLPFCGFFFHEDNLTATQLNAIRDHYLTIQP